MATSERDILPDSLKPINYDISLYDIQFSGEFQYKGIVKIEVQIKKPTNQVIINVNQVKIHTAKVSLQNSNDLEATSINHDEEAQTAVLDFDKEINGSTAVLTLEFSAYLNNLMCGFSRAKYKSAGDPPDYVPKEGDSHLMFSTQFEACDCRRALPCFDEPNLKATFDFEIEIPTGLTALSNMSEKGSRPGKEGRTIHSFERTPVMSTYLLAFAFGDFEYIEAFTERKYGGKQIPVRIYTTRGLKEQGAWGLEHSHKIIDYFSEIFQIDYPLPKADVLAVHEFAQGAMENWGLITYRTTAILFEEDKSDERWRERIAYVVAHELAHQWFGNLVTMDWWSELWLNEGFATWIGWLATDHLHPEWNYWSKFVTDSMQAAFKLDSMRASHPIEVPVNSAIDVDQIFDAISYRKGSSMIRMLSEYLGVEVFLQGIAKYLKKHSYGNATTEDLWSAISDASGKDVASFMDSWIKKIGFPVLTIEEKFGPDGTDLRITQSRFLITGDVKAEEDETVWWIPLGLKNDSKSSAKDDFALTAKEDAIRQLNSDFYKFNSDCTGFYITNYPPDRLRKLGASLADLSINDRISLIGDAAVCAKSGIGSVSGLLSLLETYRDETHAYVWQQILGTLGEFRSVFSDEKVQTALKKFTLKLITPATEKIGWESPAGESYLQASLRPALILAASGAGHEPTIQEGRRRFNAYLSGDLTAIPPTIRISVFRIGVDQDEATAYAALKHQYPLVNDAASREALVSGMSRIKSAHLVRDLMAYSFSGAIATQDLHGPSVHLSHNAIARPVMWAWVKENWTIVEDRLKGTSVAFDRWVKSSLSNFVTKKERDDVELFFKGKDTRLYSRALVQVLDSIEGNYRYREREEGKLSEWLEGNGYFDAT